MTAHPSSRPVWNVSHDLDHMRRDGRSEHPSHDMVIDWLARRYKRRFSLLDCGVMSGVTYEKLENAGLPVDYVGIDASPTVLSDCRRRFPGVAWEGNNVFDLAYTAETFDVVYARHLIESLPYYETALREMFRVARGVVVLCLGQVPAEPERLVRRETDDGHYIWLNRYAPGPFEALLCSLSASVASRDSSTSHHVNRIYFCEKAVGARLSPFTHPRRSRLSGQSRRGRYGCWPARARARSALASPIPAERAGSAECRRRSSARVLRPGQ